VRRLAYGPDPSQFGELYEPARAQHDGVVVIVHGGFWRARYELSLGAPLAADLATHGYTAWNIEYRRVGNGGGWPMTGADVAAAIDHLAELDVDSSRVVAIGHSAGGQLAVWAAGRKQARVRLAAVAAQAGVLDLRAGVAEHLGNGAIVNFLGGTPDTVPEHYRDADPLYAAPLDVPVLCVHTRTDEDVPITQSRSYVACGGQARLVEADGDHFTVIDPLHENWRVVRDALPALLAGRIA
jgi:acetyl esterase/lipase